jgi:hypothetical protein
MAEETLLTAARRVVRFFAIDMNNGGLVTAETETALQSLDRQVCKAVAVIKREGEVRIREDYGAPPTDRDA